MVFQYDFTNYVFISIFVLAVVGIIAAIVHTARS